LYNPELEFEVEDEGSDRTATAGVGLTFDVSGKRRARSALGAAELTLAEAEAAMRRTQFAQRWLQAWAERLAANERVRLGEQRVVLVQRFADLAQRQLDVGDISTLERDLALLARDEAQAQQATFISEAATAEENFFAVGGSSSETARAAEAPPVVGCRGGKRGCPIRPRPASRPPALPVPRDASMWRAAIVAPIPR
jgi:cobalt-zinc-cadmium efflux system outer membrane protein